MTEVKMKNEEQRTTWDEATEKQKIGILKLVLQKEPVTFTQIDNFVKEYAEEEDIKNIGTYEYKCRLVHKLEYSLDNALCSGDYDLFNSYLQEYKDAYKFHPEIAFFSVGPDEFGRNVDDKTKIETVRNAIKERLSVLEE